MNTRELLGEFLIYGGGAATAVSLLGVLGTTGALPEIDRGIQQVEREIPQPPPYFTELSPDAQREFLQTQSGHRQALEMQKDGRDAINDLREWSALTMLASGSVATAAYWYRRRGSEAEPKASPTPED